jgi:hypothetical protein
MVLGALNLPSHGRDHNRIFRADAHPRALELDMADAAI